MFSVDRLNKITITKGDNAQLVIELVDRYGKKREIYDDDTITLTVRKKAKSNALITKSAENGVIEFEPADTKTLAVGQYFYDIQLTTFGGKIYTVIPMSIFEIGEEITR